MPRRLIRDGILTSDKIDGLDASAERFFFRLMLVVDDFARFSADPRILRSSVFPLKGDVRTADITRWLAACEKPGLLRLYTVAGKEYLEIQSFGQQIRAKTSKFPAPECGAESTRDGSACNANDTHMRRICGADDTHMCPKTETETNRERVFACTHADGEAIEKIVNLHPKRRNLHDDAAAVISAINREMERPGASVNSIVGMMIAKTAAYANAVSSWRKKKFITPCKEWFDKGMYHDDPETWVQEDSKHGNADGLPEYIPKF